MRYDSQTVEPHLESRGSSRRGASERLYDRLLRDLFTRAVPGLVVLLAIATSVASFGEVSQALERATVWMWLLAFGGGWLTGFALLELGRRFNLALLAPEAITEEQYWTAEERFGSSASRRQHAHYERLVTIRDGMAAGSVALFVSLLVHGVDFVVDVNTHDSPWSEVRNGATASAVLVAIGIALQLVHRVYARRAWLYLSSAGTDQRQGRGPLPPVS